jgi:hypothetical protein
MRTSLLQLTHTKEKPHVCPICTRAFAISSNLKRHQRLHDIEPSTSASTSTGKPYQTSGSPSSPFVTGFTNSHPMSSNQDQSDPRGSRPDSEESSSSSRQRAPRPLSTNNSVGTGDQSSSHSGGNSSHNNRGGVDWQNNNTELDHNHGHTAPYQSARDYSGQRNDLQPPVRPYDDPFDATANDLEQDYSRDNQHQHQQQM